MIAMSRRSILVGGAAALWVTPASAQDANLYPDAVDLTLSEQGDVLVLRRVRMSAASERGSETGAQGDTEEGSAGRVL